MGDGDRRTIRTDVVERLLHNLLGSRVQCTGCFVEQEDWWVGYDTSSDSNSLLLTWVDIVSICLIEEKLLSISGLSRYSGKDKHLQIEDGLWDE